MSEEEFPKRVQGPGCLLMLAHALMFLGGFVGAGILAANFQQSLPSSQLLACKSNCKNLATALEMYSSDNQGLYPNHLALLTAGNYLKLIPTCPSAGNVTYTDYLVSPKGTYFRFSCVGNNHARAYIGFAKRSDDLPAYSSAKGLVDHP